MSYNPDLPFVLFANVQIVNGAERSLLCDLQHDTYHFIPNSLAELLSTHNKIKSIKEIKTYLKNEYDEIIDEYFVYLHDKGLIFFTDTPEWFPDLSLRWEEPFKITHAIIDTNSNNIKSHIQELQDIKCPHFQIRMFSPCSVVEWETLLEAIDWKLFLSLEIITPYVEVSKTDWLNLIKNYPVIHSISLYNAPLDSFEAKKEMGNLFYFKNALTSETHCGVIASHYFTVNIPTFTESQQHNTCLNRKISIDKDGYIKNCPSMLHHFGHISETKLEDVIKNPEFTKYWNIKKDDISKCKDCEFRHICTDCRAYLENPEDLHSAPLKCGYDPYTCQWEDWSTNPLKQKAIEHYNLTELVTR